MEGFLLGVNASLDGLSVPVFVLNASECSGVCRFPVIVKQSSDSERILKLSVDTDLKVPYEVWGYKDVDFTRTVYEDEELSVSCEGDWVEDSTNYRRDISFFWG
jgi:hypothetical protein